MPPPQPQPPKNWPLNLPYLLTSSYSPSLPSNPVAHATLHTKPTSPPPLPTIPRSHPLGPSPLVKIKPITDPAHPAAGQHGLFATRDLEPGSLIVIYLGIIHVSKPEGAISDSNGNTDPGPHSTSDYDLSLDRYTGLGIDAEMMGNEARFINDYRGVPAFLGRGGGANAEFRDVWDERGKRRGEKGVGVWVLKGKGKGKVKGIRRGEEVLVNYGRGFWGVRRVEVEKGGGMEGER